MNNMDYMNEVQSSLVYNLFQNLFDDSTNNNNLSVYVTIITVQIPSVEPHSMHPNFQDDHSYHSGFPLNSSFMIDTDHHDDDYIINGTEQTIGTGDLEIDGSVFNDPVM